MLKKTLLSESNNIYWVPPMFGAPNEALVPSLQDCSCGGQRSVVDDRRCLSWRSGHPSREGIWGLEGVRAMRAWAGAKSHAP